MNSSAAVVGVGSTPIVRQTDQSILELAVCAAEAALADAGITGDDVDGCVGIPYSPNPGPQIDGVDIVTAATLARAAGWRLRFSSDVFAMAGSAVLQVAAWVAGGHCDRVIVVRAVVTSSERPAPAGERLARGAAQFTEPYGLAPGIGRHALSWQRYMFEWGATRDDLFGVVDCQRRNAADNPLAYWSGEPLGHEKYMMSRWVCEPLCLYDCDMPVAAASAVVVTRGDLAAGHPSAAHLAFGATGPWPERELASSSIGAADVQVAQLYDGFSPFVLYWLDRLGFAEEGGSRRLIADGGIERTGRIPTNTFGGSLSEGRLHGMGHIREAALQAMGRAGGRQVADVRHSLALVGVPEDAALLVFAPEPEK